MNAPTRVLVPDVPGTPFEGGFFVAKFRSTDGIYALVVAPKSDGDARAVWANEFVEIEGAASFNDGAANTAAMAAAGSSLAKSISELSIDGFCDWYLPSRDELELIYRHLKPTAEESYGYRSGENPSANPPTHAYTKAHVQTSAPGFKEGEDNALESASYWSSTQYSRNTAWSQGFDDGDQDIFYKSAELRARAVRRFIP